MWGQDDSQLMQKVSANAKKNTRSDLDFAIFVVFEYLCGKKLTVFP